MAEVLAFSSVELMAWPFGDRCGEDFVVQPGSEPRSVGTYDLVGISSMATSPFETIAWPVVPAGMFDLATTADVLTGATHVRSRPVRLLAPSHARVRDRAAGDEQDHTDHDQYECLLLHRTFPLSNQGQRAATRDCVRPAVGSVGGYDGKGRTYIGPSDHSPLERPWWGHEMVHMSYVPRSTRQPRIDSDVSQRRPQSTSVQQLAPPPEIQRRGSSVGTADVEYSEAADAASATTSAGPR